jgi:phosphatidylglycerophosphatase C
MNKGLAVFDLDGTLSRDDTMISFLMHVFGKWNVISYFLLIFPLLMLMLFRIVRVRYIKELVMKHYFRNKTEESLRCMGKNYAEKVMPLRIFPEVYQALESHRQQGHDILLLTAALDIWAEVWCVKENILFAGTRIEFVDGRCTGRILGENCYGIRKQQVLESFLKDTSYETITAYGNESADRFYLAMAQNAYMIRNGKMQQYEIPQ